MRSTYLGSKDRGRHVDIVNIDENTRHYLVSVVCLLVILESV